MFASADLKFSNIMETCKVKFTKNKTEIFYFQFPWRFGQTRSQGLPANRARYFENKSQDNWNRRGSFLI